MTRGFPGVTPPPPGMATDKVHNQFTPEADTHQWPEASKGVFRQLAKREPDEEEKRED